VRGWTGSAAARGDEVDLGQEPPLLVGGEDDQRPASRTVSVRWLCGTILTGVASTFLMGGALMAALNNPNQFAATPESVALARESQSAPGLSFGRKGDRMRPTEEKVSSRQVLQVSTVTKQGERDFIKLRPFARIVATLTAPQPEHLAQIPAYDALRIFADTSAPEPANEAPGADGEVAEDQFYGANVDGEVSVKVSDFPVVDAGKDPRVMMSAADVEAIVRASVTFGGGETDMAALAFIDPGGTGDEFDAADPFSAMGVKIVPENVSNVTKSDGDSLGLEGDGERFIAIRKGQSFRDLLADSDVSEEDAENIVKALAQLVDLNAIHVGQKVRLAYASDGIEGGTLTPLRISIYSEGAHQATVARTDDDIFVRADEPTLAAREFAEIDEPVEVYGGSMPRLYDAVYETALEQEVPSELIEQIVRIFAYDIDFQSRISPGDSIEIFHSLPEDAPDAVEPEVLFTALTLNGTTKRFYRFRTPDDGIVDYYDEEGRSAKKFLMRKPITSGVLRSGFGSRRHPILKYVRMHTGVDFAAPRGTPILAAGNGVVEEIERNSGYGNMTVIRHTNGYETLYAHQSGYAKGLSKGARVRQGQVIGYVGSTGLSTGPHLHFEIRVNDKPVDPLRIRLPRGRVLENDMLASFERASGPASTPSSATTTAPPPRSPRRRTAAPPPPSTTSNEPPASGRARGRRAGSPPPSGATGSACRRRRPPPPCRGSWRAASPAGREPGIEPAGLGRPRS
jgi:murein DD-endopeptidase MepM/ murein hydrolase activator NlpD